MILRVFSSTFLLAALVLLPLDEACSAAHQHSVGPNIVSIEDPCTGDGGIFCNEPPVLPPDCRLGAASCVDGTPQCPLVICPADAGVCSSEGIICYEPLMGPGCYLGAASCVDGQYRCPPVVCP